MAEFITLDLRRPRCLVIAAWPWLAPETEDLDEKLRCLEAVLELNAQGQSARAGLALLHARE